MTAWLEGALKKEKEKHKACPVMPDMVPGYVDTQAWGYVVNGYLLAEQSFKALLHLRRKEVPQYHSLSSLFHLFGKDEGDQAILCEYYTDYRATIGGNRGEFPFETLTDFLENLDGGPDAGAAGSLAWRYYLIEEPPKVPSVSVDYLHEIVFGCIQMVRYASNGRFDPVQHTHSWRLRWERMKKYDDWMNVRMNSPGWDELDNKLVVLWGPDYRERHDLFHFMGKGGTGYFAEIPDDDKLPIIDKRLEVEAFDVEEGYRSIGVTFP